jgi:hypothetical protein
MITDDTLFILPCSQTKHADLAAGPMLARDAYQGGAFRMARALLEEAGARWCILSGGYGFLWPTSSIEAYDTKMEPVTEETVWDECFSQITNRQYARLMTAGRIVVLGSRLYADAAAVLLRRPVEAPVAGLPIGKMLSAIKRAEWLTAAAIA